MTEEITELNMGKYLVLKWDDIHSELSPRERELLASMIKTCNHKRKSINQYLVLNLDDAFNMPYLNGKIQDIITERMHNVMFGKAANAPLKIKDIAVILVNSILKIKGKRGV